MRLKPMRLPIIFLGRRADVTLSLNKLGQMTRQDTVPCPSSSKDPGVHSSPRSWGCQHVSSSNLTWHVWVNCLVLSQMVPIQRVCTLKYGTRNWIIHWDRHQNATKCNSYHSAEFNLTVNISFKLFSHQQWCSWDHTWKTSQYYDIVLCGILSFPKILPQWIPSNELLNAAHACPHCGLVYVLSLGSLASRGLFN